MNKILPVFLLVAAVTCLYGEEKEPKDWAFSKTIHFNIDRANDTTYTLYSEVRIRIRYLSVRSLEKKVFYIPEQFYFSVLDIKGYYNGRSIPSNRIQFQYAKDEDTFISENKIHSVQFDDVRQIGDSVVYTYRESYKDAAFIPLVYIPNTNFTDWFQLVIKHPKDVSVDFGVYFPRDTLKYEIDRSSKTRTVLTLEKIMYREPLVYFSHNQFNAVFLPKLLKSSVSLNPSTPKEFGKWYYKQLGRYKLLDDDVDSLSRVICGQHQDPIDKLKAIHNYVKENIRYIGQTNAYHAIIPHSSVQVLRNAYGDCKDRSLLVLNLARSAGINVHMVLASSVPSLIGIGIHLADFNHVINGYDDGNGILFFDPTAKYTEFGNLPFYDETGTGLWLEEDRTRSVIIRQQKLSPSIDIHVFAHLDSVGSGKGRIIFRNEMLASARKARHELKRIDLENFLSRMVNGYISNLAFDHFMEVSETDSEMTWESRADLKDFLIHSSVKKYIPTTPFLMIGSEIQTRGNDSFALHILKPHRFQMTLNLKTGNYFAADKSFEVRFDNGTFYQTEARFDSSAGCLRIRYHIDQKAMVLNGNDKRNFIDFCKNYQKNKSTVITLERRSP